MQEQSVRYISGKNALFLIKVLRYSIFTKSFLDKEPVVGKVVKQNGYEQVKMCM